MNSTIAKVYAAMIGIPLAAIMMAGAISGSDSYDYDDYERDAKALEESGLRDTEGGSSVSEAEAYSTLGKYTPCIFIECEGE